MPEPQSENGQSPPPYVEDDEISLLDLAIVLAKYKGLVIGLPAVVAVIAVIVSLSMTPIYTATTKILPPEQSQSSASAMLAQLGGLASLAGGKIGVKNPNDVYLAMLNSRTVADSMIQRFDLGKYYDAELKSETREFLASNTKIESGKDGIITIEVDDKDPKRAADMANAYVEELTKLTGVLAVTEASQRRLFFEQQLQQTREHLSKAEVSAKHAIETGGITNIDAQGRALLETTARLRAQISVKQVQIGAMRSFAADQNPELLQAQRELAAMRAELARIEGTGQRSATGPANGRGFENLALIRDVKYHEAVYELLLKQFEAAKLDEAKNSAIIQVMDKAVVPDRKSKPKRSLILAIATFAAFFLAMLLVFLVEALDRARRSPESAERFKLFRSHLRIKR